MPYSMFNVERWCSCRFVEQAVEVSLYNIKSITLYG